MKTEIVIDHLGNEHIVIDNGDGSFTSMTKAHYDELQAKRESGEII